MNMRFLWAFALFAVVVSGCDDEPAGRACVADDACRVNEICADAVCGPIPPFDDDGDGVPDAIEQIAGTDPTLVDTDGDGADDAAELGWMPGTRLFDGPDTDADGTIDARESSVADADGDGVPDQSDPCDADPLCPEMGPAPCEADEGETCVLGVGACTELGVTVCTDDGADVECVGDVGTPTGEACTGIDDDCDGQTDEGFEGLGTPCEDGVGGCRVEGEVACTADGRGVACNAVATEPGDEVCDGVDNDCDGEVDEDFPDVGFVCETGLGQCNARGVFECTPGGAGVRCAAEAALPGDELCNRLDDDCDGRIDEDFARVGQACEVGVGGCMGRGAFRCNDAGDDTVCDATEGAPVDEVCDEVDNDCDGMVDEGFPELGAPCEDGIGACRRPGVQVCSADGQGYRCGAELGEGAGERCNEVDDDCDGVIDEDIEGLGDACAEGVGVCRVEGTIVCDRLNEEPVCDARATPPREEICNALDDDCDGQTDEGFPTLGDACAAGVGACAVEGTIVCAVDPREVVCDAEEAVAGQERCNGDDDDCDGLVDEEYGVGDACTAGLGLCARDGVIACDESGDGTCIAELGLEAPETCDGRDEDCDGRVDEDFDVGGQCVVGVGECVRDGLRACADDGVSTRCDAEPGPAGDEVCNDLDDDCDGFFDEDFDGLFSRCQAGEGECQVNGRFLCAEDGASLVCDAVPEEPSPAERCDGRDDDCDGAVDESFPNLGEACEEGVGACRDEGVFACRRGDSLCTAQAGDPRAERCDQTDDDCDGQVDEDFGPDCARRLLDVSAGGYHTCARRPDREVLCWGDVDPPPAGVFASLYAGPGWHCALNDAGAPTCWGDGPEAQFAVPPGPFVELALGTTHGCALIADGTPRCWGVDQSGETLPPPGRFTALAAGPAITCGITEGRTIACWGANDNQRAEPPEGAFTAIAVGSEHGCALNAEQQIVCWGADGLGRLDAPAGVFAEIAAGDFHTCARDAEGAVECWGAGGDGRPEQYPHFGQSVAPEAPPFVEISAGALHTCGRAADDTVTCWGAGEVDDPDDGFFQVGQSTVP